jgi:hypothetical protein
MSPEPAFVNNKSKPNENKISDGRHGRSSTRGVARDCGLRVKFHGW